MSIKTLQEILSELQEEETRDGTQTLVPTDRDRDTGVPQGTKKAHDEPKHTHKTHKTSPQDPGMIATWSRHFSYISLRDPFTGEWCDLQVKDAPGWALGESRRRKELWRDGRKDAYRLTSREMEELWTTDHEVEDEGIVEDFPVEEEVE